MTSRARARRTAVAAVLAAVLAATVGACGVDPQSTPEPVPQDRLPQVMPTASGGPSTSRTQVWGVREQRVVPVVVSLPVADVMTRLQALLELVQVGQAPVSAVAPRTRAVSVVRRERLIVVSLSAEFRSTPEKDLPLALAQVVLTLTEHPGVEEVEVRVDDEVVGLRDERGAPVARPLRRTDVEGLVEGGRLAPPSASPSPG